MDIELVAAYFNHGIRQDAGQEEEWVKDFCRDMDIPLHMERGDVTGFCAKEKLNLEHAASLLRHAFLKKTANQYQGCKIATAHSKSDQAETFFIKLLRGSGTRGLSAIYSSKGAQMIRPLLEFTQEEILAFLERNQLSFYGDYSNEQDVFLRNKLRRRLMPLVKEFSPNIENHIAKTVEQLQTEHDYFSNQAEDFLNRNLILDKILPIAALAGQHKAIQRHALRRYIHRLKGDLLNLDFRHIEEIIAQIPGGRGLSIPGVELKFHGEFIYPRDIRIAPFNYRVESPCTLEIGEIRRVMQVTKISKFSKPTHNREITIPYSARYFPLTIRSFRQGDSYTKLNAPFKQEVKEMIRETGYPTALRNLCPLVLDSQGKIIWSYGSPVAASFKVSDPDRGPFLHLSLA